MSWNPLLDPGRPDAVGHGLDRNLDRASGASTSTPSSAARCPRRSARWSGRSSSSISLDRWSSSSSRLRRAPPPTHRPRHRHLSLSRRGASPGQSRHEPDHRSRGRQLDGRGAGHHPFRTPARRAPGTPRSGLWHPDLGRPAGARGGRRAEVRASSEGGFAGPRGRRSQPSTDPRHGLWRRCAGQRLLRHLLRRRRAAAWRPHAAARRSRRSRPSYPGGIDLGRGCKRSRPVR